MMELKASLKKNELNAHKILTECDNKWIENMRI